MSQMQDGITTSKTMVAILRMDGVKYGYRLKFYFEEEHENVGKF